MGSLPPVWTRCRPEDELIAVVDDYESVGGVGRGDKDDTHFVYLAVASVAAVCILGVGKSIFSGIFSECLQRLFTAFTEHKKGREGR